MYVERAVWSSVTVAVLMFVITVSTYFVTEVTSIVEVTRGYTVVVELSKSRQPLNHSRLPMNSYADRSLRSKCLGL